MPKMSLWHIHTHTERTHALQPGFVPSTHLNVPDPAAYYFSLYGLNPQCDDNTGGYFK